MAVVLVLGLLPVAVGAAVVGRESRRHERTQLDRHLDQAAQAQATALEEYFTRSRDIVLQLAQNSAFRESYAGSQAHRAVALNEAGRALAFLETLYPNSIGEACFIDGSGNELARVVRGVRAGEKQLSPDESKNPFFAPTFALPPGVAFQAQPYVSPDTHEWVVANSSRVPLPGGAGRAIVHFEVTIESFRRRLGRADSVVIVDARTGRVVADGARPQRLGAPLGNPADRRFAFLGTERHAAGARTDHGRRLVYVRAGADSNNANAWYVVASAPAVGLSLVDAAGGLVAILLLSLAVVCVAAAVGYRWARTNHLLEDRNDVLLRQTAALERSLGERDAAEAALRESEERLRHAQKLEAVGQLAGGIAHDFNNLLMAVRGYADLLTTSVLPEAPEGKWVASIRTAADRAVSLTQQLLAFGRKQMLMPEMVPINGAVSEAGELLSRLLPTTINVEFSLASDAGAVRVDPAQLTQMVVNLAVNARDAMPGGGTLEIATSRGEFTHPPDPDLLPGWYVEISVRDTGGGMTSDVRARAFEPFFTTKPVGAGTGLGLATVYGIAKQHEGTVSIETAPGVGTTVTIVLPSVEAEAEIVTVPRPPPPAAGSEHVLLVEDDAVVRGLTADILGRAGYSVVACSDGSEALAAIDAGADFDVVVTDVVMPLLSGPDLVHEIRNRRADVPVVFMSGYTADVLTTADVTRRDECFLGKPFSADELARTLRELLDRRPIAA